MRYEDIAETLSDESIGPVWDKTLSKWKNGSPEEKQKLKDWISEKRDFFLSVARMVDDEEDRMLVTLIRYIETKSAWIQLNNLVNQGLARTGERNEEAMYRASLLSRTLRIIETKLNESELDKMTDSLAEPVEEGGFQGKEETRIVQVDLEKAFAGPEIEASWRETFDSLENLDSDSKKELKTWISEIRDKFLDVNSKIVNDDDRKHVLAALYMETKSLWMQLNHFMNYRMVNTGEYDERDMAKASLLTKILEASETVLSGDDIDKLTSFLAKPFP